MSNEGLIERVEAELEGVKFFESGGLLTTQRHQRADTNHFDPNHLYLLKKCLEALEQSECVVWQNKEVIGEEFSGTWKGLSGDVDGDSLVLYDEDDKPALCLRLPIFESITPPPAEVET